MKKLITPIITLMFFLTIQAQPIAFDALVDERGLTELAVDMNVESAEKREVYLLFSNMSSDAFCQGSEVSLSASPGDFSFYSFYHDGELIQSGNSQYLKVDNLNAGVHVFQVYAADDSGSLVSKELKFEVNEPDQPMISIVGSRDLSQGESVKLVASFGGTYKWSTGEESQVVEVSKPGIYSVEVTDENGCVGASNSIEINLLKPDQDDIKSKKKHNVLLSKK